MTIKILVPNNGTDSLEFGSAVTDVAAEIVGTEISSGEGKLVFKTTTSGTSTERIRLLNNGKLEAQSPASATGLQPFTIDWRNENNAGIMASIACDRTASSAAPGALVFRTSTSVDSGAISEKMRVMPNGNVGIGTTAPEANLHIIGNASGLNDGTIALFEGNNDGGNRGIHIGQEGSGSQGWPFIQSYHSQAVTNYWELLLNPYGGNVGIGTTDPAGKFAVSDGTTTGEINPTGGICWMGTRSNHPVAFQVNASEKMRINNAGQVTMPYQPAFNVTSTASRSAQDWTYTTTYTNRGSHMNTGTGLFTAPVAGVYIFFFGTIGTTTHADTDLYLKINGSTSRGGVARPDDSGSWASMASGTGVMSLSANDTVGVWSSQSNAYSDGNQWLHFRGYLAG
jgi:hypothetical protein